MGCRVVSRFKQSGTGDPNRNQTNPAGSAAFDPAYNIGGKMLLHESNQKLMAAGDEASFRYVALEIRMAIEPLFYSNIV